jgi:hypothetical protein
MNKKISKITTWLAAAVFLFALAINVKTTMNDPFVSLSEEALAVTTTTTPQSWASTYPECEFTITVGMPPLEVTKTIRGTYRICAPGGGLCLYSDGVCCVRVGGICML